MYSCYDNPMKPSIKFILYVRKSTDEQNRQVMSLDSQVVELRAFANREHIFIHEIVEESRTAKHPGRPLFNQILDRIDKGEANGLLCWDVDRLYRNPIDEGRVRWLLQKGIIASIRTPSRQFFPEDAGLLMGVEGGRATDYIIRLAKNVRRGVQEKLRRGEWPGAKPVGYIYDHRLRNIVPDPKKAPIVQTIFQEVATGRHGLLSVSDRLFHLGVTSRTGRPWSKFAVWQFLTNRLFIGVMEWKGEQFEGKYTPILTPELFKQVQQALKIKSKPRRVRQGHNFPFCGVFHCTCGSMITAQWAKGHGGLYRYYRCTRKGGSCSERYTQEEQVRQQCLGILAPLALSAEDASLAHARIDEYGSQESLTLNTELKAMQEKVLLVQGKLDRLTRGYLDQLIDEESYRTAKEELVLEKTGLKAEKERLHKSRSSYWIEPAREVIKTLETLGKTDTANNLPELSRLVRKIGTNHQISRKQVSFSLSAPYDFVACLRASHAIQSSTSISSRSDENPESPMWCAGQDSNLRRPMAAGFTVPSNCRYTTGATKGY